jgi:uncharacterized protein YbcI
MQQHVNHIKAILQQFQKEEIGNRLSMFAVAALQGMIDTELTAIQKKWEEEIAKHKENAETPSPEAAKAAEKGSQNGQEQPG